MYDDPQRPEQPPYGTPQWGEPTQYVPPPGQGQPPYGAPQEEPPYGSPQGQSPYGAPQGQPPYGPPPYGVPPMPGPGYPGYMPPPQQKKSLRWLWITLGILGGLIVIACGACAYIGVRGASFVKQAVGPSVVVEQYYQAVQKQDYTTAYTYVAQNATLTIDGKDFTIPSQQSYTTVAQALDKSLGTMTSHSAHLDGSDTSHFIVTVTRGGKQYIVHLTLSQFGNDWKITSADGI
jgi:hypothetical protein